jgi:hypothetical protein
MSDEHGCCGEKMKERLDAIFQALPAKSVEEIANRIGDGEGSVSVTLSHLRKHAIEHGWTVPHARRGPTMDDDRLFAVLVDPKGEPYFDSGSIQLLRHGLRGTARHAASLCQNEARAIRLAAQRVKSRVIKRQFVDLADDLDYTGRKATAVEFTVATADENGEEVFSDN